jgi:hypothetical protein
MRDLSCYDYVNVPYEKVAAALRADSALALFQRATSAAATRAGEIETTLRVALGPIEIAAGVDVEITGFGQQVSALGERSLRLDLRWSATRNAGWFPTMSGTLWAYPLSGHETQLELTGKYEPPLGPVGAALDAAVGHRVAQASVLRFVQDLAARLRKELATQAA